MFNFFLLSLASFLFTPIFLPEIRFFSFAPFLALIFWKHSYIQSLWIAAFVGLFVDCLNHSLPFGTFCLGYTILAAICHLYRRRFVPYSLFSLPFYTAFLSLYFVPIQIFTLHFFQTPIDLSLLDFLLMPLLDGLYAFFWFTWPYLVYNRSSTARRLIQ